ncbi:MAG: hypothetical protein ACM3NQ_19800 [Bacteroidales bacterium]
MTRAPRTAQAAVTVVLLLLMSGRHGAAQTPSGDVPVPDLKKWDAAGTIGWHLHAVDAPAATPGYGGYDYRVSSFYAGVSVGRYWTEHLKTEFEVARGGTVHFSYGEPYAGGSTYPYGPYVYARDTVTETQVTAEQAYQFFHNAWFHPFVGAGVVAARESHAMNRPAQQVPIYSAGYPSTITGVVDVPAASSTRVTWKAHPFVATGFKAYVSYHAFFRADFRVAFNSGVQATLARVGFGLDF